MGILSHRQNRRHGVTRWPRSLCSTDVTHIDLWCGSSRSNKRLEEVTKTKSYPINIGFDTSIGLWVWKGSNDIVLTGPTEGGLPYSGVTQNPLSKHRLRLWTKDKRKGYHRHISGSTSETRDLVNQGSGIFWSCFDQCWRVTFPCSL